MKTTKIILIIFLASLLSCQSDEDIYQLVEPGPYLPVCPNSWWKYQYNDSLIVIDSTSDNYILNSYQTRVNPDVYSEKAYVPFYYPDSMSPMWLIEGPVYRYNRVDGLIPPTNSSAPYKSQYPILTMAIGASFDRWPADRYNRYSEKVTVDAMIFNGADSVLIQSIRHYVDDLQSDSYVEVQEFTKNIGLTKDFVLDTLTNDTAKKWILIDYYISKN
jgi:hypothetical protein